MSRVAKLERRFEKHEFMNSHYQRVILVLGLIFLMVSIGGCSKSKKPPSSQDALAMVEGSMTKHKGIFGPGLKDYLEQLDSGAAESSVELWTDSEFSTLSMVKVGGERTLPVIRNHSYFAYSAPESSTKGQSLIVSQSVEKICFFGEGDLRWLVAEGWLVDGNSKRKKLWSISQDADVGEKFSFNYYRTIQFGCCGSLDIGRLYDPESGKKILSYADELLNYHGSLIGSIGAGYLQQENPGLGDSLSCCALFLVLSDQTVHTLLLSAKSSDAFNNAVNEMSYVEMSILPLAFAREAVDSDSSILAVSSDFRDRKVDDLDQVLRLELGYDSLIFMIRLTYNDFEVNKTDFPDFTVKQLN